MTVSFVRSNLDAIGAGALARGESLEGVRLEHPRPWAPGTPLGPHLRIERLVRILEGRQLYLANNVNPLWRRHRKCWHCGNTANPDLAQACVYCGTPLLEQRFLASVRHDGTTAPGWEALVRMRLEHPVLIEPVAAFYREERPVTIFPYNGERLLLDQPAPMPAQVLVPMAHRLAVGIGALHKAGIRLVPLHAGNVLVMPDGSARLSDLEAIEILDQHALARHPDRPILADVRALCQTLLPYADPDDEALVDFLIQGVDGKYGAPRRFCAALEHFHDRLVEEPHDPVHAGFTDVGLTRMCNEDSWGWRRIDDKTVVYVVADGMGGHERGEVASAMAVSMVIERVTSGVRDGRSRPEVLEKILIQSIEEANQAVHAAGGGEAPMGATILALLLLGGRQAVVAHAGDCRAYLLRGKQLKPVTTDHSLVQAMVERGTVKPEEARTHPKANVILNYIGQDAEIDVDCASVKVLPGDRWLLCSDGLWGELTDAELSSHLLTWREPRRCVQRLVREAYEAGGRDNITVVVVDVLK